ncbi:hypothetical protein GQ457_07G008260 [Hibiscus cannabinus]
MRKVWFSGGVQEGVAMTRYCSIGALEDKRRKRQNSISGRTGGQNEEKTKIEDILQPTCDPHQLANPHCWSFKLGFLVASREGRQTSGSRQLLRTLQVVELDDGTVAFKLPGFLTRDSCVLMHNQGTMYGVQNPVEDPVAPEFQAAHLELNPLMFDMLNSIGQFGGTPHEDARHHMHSFLEVYRARAWLSGVPSYMMKSWTDLCKSFLLQHNPPNMNTQLRNDIASFRQADDESMFECWDRYKGLLRKMVLDASANGTLLDKSPEEAFDILDRIANNDYQFHASRLGSGRRTHGRLDLDPNDSVSAQLLAITNMLKNLQRPSPVKEIPVASFSRALFYGIHHVNECPENHDSANYMWNFNMSNENPYSNTYDLGWSQHPNFSRGNQEIHNIGSSNRQQNLTTPPGFQQNMLWQNDNQGSASSSNINSLEDTLVDFMTTTKALLQDHAVSIKSQEALLQSRGTLLQSHSSSLKALETQVGQIAQALHARPHGSLPSDTKVTKPQGNEKCSASTLKEAKFGGETLGEPNHEILFEESRLHDDSPLMESMSKGLMSGPNDERQNIATTKDNPPPVGVDDQRVTINVFNTLKYDDDFRECQLFQDVESMMANEEPAEFCCSNFSQIEDYLKLEDEDNNEIKEYQREMQQSSIIIARPGMQFEPLYFAEFSFPKPLFEHPPTLELKLLSSYLEHLYLGSNETLHVNNAGHLSRIEIMKELRNEIEIKEEFPDEKLLFAATTLWYANIANFLNKFMHVVPCCHWGDPYLCKECNDRMIRRCVPKEEQKEIIFHCHSVSLDNGLNVDVPLATMPQQLQHPSTNEEAHPTYGAQDKPTTIIIELVKSRDDSIYQLEGEMFSPCSSRVKDGSCDELTPL